MIILQAKHLVPSTFLAKVVIYGVIWYNSWFLNPDRYINLNIFETTNPKVD